MATGTERPVRRRAAFWDTSALVPLCVRQGITPHAIALFKRHQVVVWWSTPVEMASAFARLSRMNQIDSDDYLTARKLARDLSQVWSVIQPTETLRAKAVQLLDRHDLRAADSLQLAAALEWCEDLPHGRMFLAFDEKLREAALRSGFDAERI